MKPWKILSSRQTYKDRWLSIRTDEVETGKGVVLPDYHILEYRDWVTVLAFTEAGKLIAIREYRHGAQAITIGLPAGTTEEGEDDVEAVARREFSEETGYEAKEWIKVGQAYSNWAAQNNQVHFFLALGATKTSEQDLDPAEEIDVVEMDYETYLNFDGIDPQQCHHAAMLHYVERFFSKNPAKRPA